MSAKKPRKVTDAEKRLVPKLRNSCKTCACDWCESWNTPGDACVLYHRDAALRQQKGRVG